MGVHDATAITTFARQSAIAAFPAPHSPNHPTAVDSSRASERAASASTTLATTSTATTVARTPTLRMHGQPCAQLSIFRTT